MKKIINIFLIIFILIGTLITNIIDVKANEGSCSTYYVVNSKGEKYCVPQSIINTPFELSYRNVVESGKLYEKDKQIFEKIGNDIKNRDYVNFVNTTFDGIFNGLSYKSMEGYSKCLFNPLSFSVAGVCNLKTLKGDDLYNNRRDTGYRNYYTKPIIDAPGSSANTYNSGSTQSYRVVNSSNKTINYYQDNTLISNTYNDYTYNIYNNTYTYNMVDNSVINVTNNIDNSVVNVISNGTTVSNKYYFQLPDGSNSFNLTPEKIKGYKLDFNVKNYDDITDSGGLVGLFHFNGDKENSAYDSDIQYTIGNNNFINDSSTHFDSYLNFSEGRHDILNLNVSGIKSLDFRFKPHYGKQFRFTYFHGAHYTHLADIEKSTNQVVNYVEKETTAIIQKDVIGHLQHAKYICQQQGGTYNGKWRPQEGDPKKTVITCLVEQKTTTRLPIPTVENVVNKEGFIDSIHFGQWNHIAFIKKGSNFDVYINGNFWKSLPIVNNTINLVFKGDSFFGIDELRINKNNVYKEGSNKNGNRILVPNTPYDTDLVYTLPKTSKNNTILIQSRLKIKDVRFGGVRKSNPLKGDVFIHVGEDNVITGLQQFNGADWRLIPSSVYDEELVKWVDIKDTKITLDKNKKHTIDTDKTKPSDGVGNGITNIFEKGTNFWDALISFFENSVKLLVEFPKSASKFVVTLTSLFKTLFVPSKDFFKTWRKTSFENPKIASYYNLYKESIQFLNFFDLTENTEISKHLIEWNSIQLQGVQIIPSGSFSFNDFLQSNDKILQVYNYYLAIVDIIIFLLLVNLVNKKVLHYLNR